jgi:hypothetical protein
MKKRKDKIREIISNLEGTVKKMGNSTSVESMSSAFQITRAKKSTLVSKIKELKAKLNG